ncbi:hypothetical protein CTI12_AA260920 [Artemisia annua]|uniref:Uncharacterized protein n=1 Tax=Artemisia annua TaxID=35608 RepID=A0A2U1NI66_ARTAN|nr:hypothetical protein CTI12_AA260920 [Artemisia annua]
MAGPQALPEVSLNTVSDQAQVTNEREATHFTEIEKTLHGVLKSAQSEECCLQRNMQLLTNALRSYQLPVIPFPPSVTDSDEFRPSSFSDQIVGSLPDIEQLILMKQSAHHQEVWQWLNGALSSLVRHLEIPEVAFPQPVKTKASSARPQRISVYHRQLETLMLVYEEEKQRIQWMQKTMSNIERHLEIHPEPDL